MSFNKVILHGNLCRDPELKYTPKGTAVANGSIAINERWTTDQGEKKEEVSFFDFKVFGRQAEALAQYKKKGEQILLEGRLKQETWEDKQTQKTRSKVVVIVEQAIFIGGAKTERPEEEPRQRQTASRPTKPAPPADADMPPPEQDDVPF